jgi:hypothetical protein
MAMAHETKRTVAKVAVVVAAAALAACGGGMDSSGKIGPAGGAVTAAGVRVSFPPGALSKETQVTVTELPRREGESRRVHIGPDDTVLSKPATVVIRSDDGDASDEKLVEIEHGVEGEIEHGLETERHDEAEHGREAEVHHLGEFELRHARVCDVACGVGFECDDGICKVHEEDEDPANASSTTTCPVGMELDASDGICKPHGGSGSGA